MEHPQPAFDLLTSLPTETRVEDFAFVDWYAYDTIDAEREDDIASHPEIWKNMELPHVLTELSIDDRVSIQPFNGEMNLNALAIGLGLEDLRYEPDVFPGIVYDPAEHEATVLLFSSDIIVSVGNWVEETANALDHTLVRIKEVGLGVDLQLEARQTSRVSHLI